MFRKINVNRFLQPVFSSCIHKSTYLYQKRDKFICLCKLVKSKWQLAKGLAYCTFANSHLNSVGTFYPVRSIILLLIVMSCEFQPSNIPLTQIEKPSENAPTLLIEVTPDMDTLKLAGDVWTEYKMYSLGSEIRWIKIYFDDKEMYNGNYNPDYLPRFAVVSGSYPEGLHHITIQTFASSQTGSIADKMGAEGYLYEAVWPVIIAHQVSPVINIRSLNYKNPGVEVVWDKYDYYGFQSYQFTKGTVIDGNKVEKQFTDSKQTSYTDYTYIEGEYAWYSVSLSGWYSESKEFVKPIETPLTEYLPGQKLKVMWRKTSNPGQLAYYHVKLSAPPGARSEEFTVNNPSDTSVVFNTPGFGSNYEIQVRYVPKTYTGPYINYNSAGGITNWSRGNTMPSFSRGFNLNETGEVLLYGQGKFMKYNAETGTVVDSLRVNIIDPENIHVSETGRFFSYFTNDEFVLRETETWDLVNHFKVPFYYFNSFAARSLSISDNYLMAVVDHWSVLSVYDCRTGNEVFRKVGNNINSIMSAGINSDGSKIVYMEVVNYGEGKVLRLANYSPAGLTDLGEMKTADYDYRTWISFAGDEIIILNNTFAYNYTAEIRSTTDFSVISQMKFPERFVPLAFDAKHKQAVLKYGYAGGYDYGYVVDLKNPGVEKTISYLGDYRSRYLISNGIVMCNTGRFLSVNDLKLD